MKVKSRSKRQQHKSMEFPILTLQVICVHQRFKLYARALFYRRL